ncbi:MAG: hypothetical protein QG646_700, partial [Euryarchaeota archaeon]|nr:hypothetical protein [Euryarchaeota archaeon]
GDTMLKKELGALFLRNGPYFNNRSASGKIYTKDN